MARIHALAHVDPAARIDDDAEIGPFCTIGPEVAISAGCRLVSHVAVMGRTSIGSRTVVHPHASLGGAPQSAAYRGEPTRLVIGADCEIREGVTISLGTEPGGGVTQVGDRAFLMALSHVGHDCKLGHDVTFANGATLGGHCEIADFVFVGGLTTAHQHSRVGVHAMVGGSSALNGHVIPFAMTSGIPARIIGVNAVGMRRRGFSPDAIARVRHAVRALFGPGPSLEDRIAAVEDRFGAEPAVAEILTFVRARGKRPLARPRPRGDWS